ncbi:1,2-phenylacetyl-CoA epoxidase subunit PaaE [Streptomyces triticirhizae]|uniref:Phenylacetate-CoA oxygenase/reductase subunit PaaK n=1 Tax=Streptomyces triticirhizae TaxID=2483353 RepID=A0A3M2LYJ8_9ACTN|nr:1,2-phenylacetyl-CoA epoxidase subunit PaaE [Streptomyces triticirhizae]RMI42499.1 phenylacetate-CoA oxygenase/reductase subunit PaaK [Streptomyces triticirhizae]
MGGATAGRGVFHRLRIARVEPLCEDAVAVTFDVPAELAGVFAFAPGQWLTVRRWVDGRQERRSYSVCAPVGAAPRIGVRLVPGGLVSTWLVREAAPGDVVEVAPPAGTFTPDLSVPDHHVLVAAGSGVTPMVSIAGSVLERCPGARVTLLYGNRASGSVMFVDELAGLKDAFPTRFQLVHVLSREPREVEVLSGRLDGPRLEVLARALLDPGVAHRWWLCGPLPMVEEARRALARLGVDGARVRGELFHAGDEGPPPVRRADGSAVPAGGPASRVTLLLDGRATTVELPRGQRVLDGAQRARPELPFACRGGVCGTCRARVKDGRVAMRRNFALDPAEVAAGYVLTCQAVPETEAVTLDYDG